jgi:4-diphosphocytidyl-2-C-methyl-D-erythritol kinase
MIQFPNAKLNLGLHITRRREDGYHELDTVFYPAAVYDALEFVPGEDTKISFSGKEIPESNKPNLVLQAYELLKSKTKPLPPLHIYLHKVIPFGAGLGGGSADAAFMLMMLNKEFQLNISKSDLKRYATQLGSDCAFFIENTPCYATGRGEILQPISLNLTKCFFVLVKPNIHSSTAWAFSQIIPTSDRPTTASLVQLPVTEWKNCLQNDFEKPLFTSYPELLRIKEVLYSCGACYASLSGSGSTVFGLFDKEVSLKEEFKNEEIFSFWGRW